MRLHYILLCLAVFIEYCQGLVVHFGFYVNSQQEEGSDYVELGQLTVLNKGITQVLKPILHDLIIDFLFSESRVNTEADVYRIRTKIADVHQISDGVYRYKLKGEIESLKQYILTMLLVLQREQTEPQWAVRGINAEPYLFSRSLKAFCLDSEIEVLYQTSEIDLDGFLVMRMFSKTKKPSVVNDEGYTLLISQKSDESTLKPKRICENCHIS